MNLLVKKNLEEEELRRGEEELEGNEMGEEPLDEELESDLGNRRAKKTKIKFLI